MPSPLMLPAAVERAAAAARHGWGPTRTLADLPSLAAAQAGMHAARLLTPYVTAHARLPGFTGGDLRAALAPGGRLVKIRCMRRTLHLWPLDQAADAHAATLRLRLGATEATARRHGINQAALRRWGNHTRDALGDGPRDYRDLQEILGKRAGATVEDVRLGIKWAWESGQVACTNTAASLHRERRQFALTEHAHPGLVLTGAETRPATVALVRRYLHAYGPAADGDLAWWSGLTRAQLAPALASLRGEITTVAVEGLPGELLVLGSDLQQLRATPPLPADHVRLLAFEDPTFKGYFTTRARYVDPAHAAQAFNRIGEVHAAITAAGRIVGTWHWEKRRRTVTAQYFTALSREIQRRVDDQLHAAEAFLRTEPG